MSHADHQIFLDALRREDVGTLRAMLKKDGNLLGNEYPAQEQGHEVTLPPMFIAIKEGKAQSLRVLVDAYREHVPDDTYWNAPLQAYFSFIAREPYVDILRFFLRHVAVANNRPPIHCMGEMLRTILPLIDLTGIGVVNEPLGIYSYDMLREVFAPESPYYSVVRNRPRLMNTNGCAPDDFFITHNYLAKAFIDAGMDFDTFLKGRDISFTQHVLADAFAWRLRYRRHNTLASLRSAVNHVTQLAELGMDFSIALTNKEESGLLINRSQADTVIAFSQEYYRQRADIQALFAAMEHSGDNAVRELFRKGDIRTRVVDAQGQLTPAMNRVFSFGKIHEFFARKNWKSLSEALEVYQTLHAVVRPSWQVQMEAIDKVSLMRDVGRVHQPSHMAERINIAFRANRAR